MLLTLRLKYGTKEKVHNHYFYFIIYEQNISSKKREKQSQDTIDTVEDSSFGDSRHDQVVTIPPPPPLSLCRSLARSLVRTCNTNYSVTNGSFLKHGRRDEGHFYPRVSQAQNIFAMIDD